MRRRIDDALGNTGEIIRFGVLTVRTVGSWRAWRYSGEALRQAGILITSSALVLAGLMFIIGTTCGVEGAFFNRNTGSPAYSGLFVAWCNLREAAPYAFGYMMAAKVGTGYVAELGAMRVSDEIDALEVMAIDTVAFLCATRLIAVWIVTGPIYLLGIGASYVAGYLAVIQVGDTSGGAFGLIFWFFQSPLDVIFSVTKGFAMATLVVIVGCYYGYTARGGSVGVGTAAAKSMVVNIVGVHIIGMVGTYVFWGADPHAPIGG